MCRMSRSRTNLGRVAIAGVLLGTTLAGCSDLYLDRRETISSLAGESIAANRVTQGIDPWSPASANRNIAYNGEKMQTASERYRTNRVIPPVNATTSSFNYQQAQQAAQAAQSSTAPAASSGGATVK